LDARESELCQALLDAYRSREEFEELLDCVEQSLNQLVPASLDLRITVKRVVRRAWHDGWIAELEDAALEDKPRSLALKAWYQKFCAPGPGRAIGGTAPAWQLMDSAYFDLLEIRRRIRGAMSQSAGQVIGIGVTDPEAMFVSKLMNWLQSHARNTELKDRLYLNPLVRNRADWLEYVREYREYRETFRESTVLLEVFVDSMLSDDAIVEFWTGVCQDFGGGGQRLILVFVGIRDSYPDGITVLPAPQFKREDIEDWAETVLRQRGWPLDLATPWATSLCVRAARDGQPSVLDVRRLYRAMDDSILDFRGASPEQFRVLLQKRT
jgi:hypothetical protein